MEKENESEKVPVGKDVKDLSADEFKDKLYSWFQKHGLASQMRSHFRHQMILMLRDTELGETLATTTRHGISPKLQALHLLLAEFLMHSQNHFTLSIFVSEVPFLNLFPEFVVPSNVLSMRQPTQITRMKPMSVISILEMLGLPQSSRDGNRIFKLYHKTPEEPLIAILLQCLCENALPIADDSADLEQLEYFTNPKALQWNAAINELLHNAKVCSPHLELTKERIYRMYQTEVERLRTEEQLKYKAAWEERENALLAEARSRERYLKTQANEIEMKYTRLKSNCSDELKGKQEFLENLAEQLHTQLENVTRSMDHLERRSEELTVHERELRDRFEQKSTEVIELNVQLQQKASTVCEREQYIWNLQKSMDKLQRESNLTIEQQMNTIKDLQSEKVVLQKLLDEERNRASVAIFEAQAEQENSKAVHDMYLETKNENEMLRQRLDELTSRSEQLNRDLQTRPPTFVDNSFSSEHMRAPPFYLPGSRVIMAPPLTSGSAAQARLDASNRRLGGGEESFQSDRTASPIYRHVTHMRQTRESQRRTPRRLLVHSSPSSESGPTEDILQEARQRLRKLEEDTKRVEANYERYRSRSPIRFVDLFRFANESMRQAKIPDSGPTPSTIFHATPDLADIVKRMEEIRSSDYKDLCKSDSVRFFSGSLPMSDAVPLYFQSRPDIFMTAKEPPVKTPPVDEPPRHESPRPQNSEPEPSTSRRVEVNVFDPDINENIENIRITCKAINPKVSNEQLSKLFKQMQSTFASFDSTACEVSKNIECLAKSSCQLSKDMYKLPSEVPEEKDPAKLAGENVESPSSSRPISARSGSEKSKETSPSVPKVVVLPRNSTGAVKKKYTSVPDNVGSNLKHQPNNGGKKSYNVSENGSVLGEPVCLSPRFTLAKDIKQPNYTLELDKLQASLHAIDNIERKFQNSQTRSQNIFGAHDFSYTQSDISTFVRKKFEHIFQKDSALHPIESTKIPCLSTMAVEHFRPLSEGMNLPIGDLESMSSESLFKSDLIPSSPHKPQCLIEQRSSSSHITLGIRKPVTDLRNASPDESSHSHRKTSLDKQVEKTKNATDFTKIKPTKKSNSSPSPSSVSRGSSTTPNTGSSPSKPKSATSSSRKRVDENPGNIKPTKLAPKPAVQHSDDSTGNSSSGSDRLPRSRLPWSTKSVSSKNSSKASSVSASKSKRVSVRKTPPTTIGSTSTDSDNSEPGTSAKKVPTRTVKSCTQESPRASSRRGGMSSTSSSPLESPGLGRTSGLPSPRTDKEDNISPDGLRKQWHQASKSKKILLEIEKTVERNIGCLNSNRSTSPAREHSHKSRSTPSICSIADLTENDVSIGFDSNQDDEFWN